MAWASKGWGSTFGITDKTDADCLAGCCPHDEVERQIANKNQKEPGVFFMSPPVCVHVLTKIQRGRTLYILKLQNIVNVVRIGYCS